MSEQKLSERHRLPSDSAELWTAFLSEPLSEGGEQSQGSQTTDGGTLPSSEAHSQYAPPSRDPSDVEQSSDCPALSDDPMVGNTGELAKLEARAQLAVSPAKQHGKSTRGPALEGYHAGAIARAKLATLPYRQDGWCRLCTLAPNKGGGGYIQVTVDGHNHLVTTTDLCLLAAGSGKPVINDLRKFYPAAVAAGIEEFSDLPGFVGGQGPLEGSHLCGHSFCIVPEHVVAETHAANEARKNCYAWLPCLPDCQRCEGTGVTIICPHAPPCIRFFEGYDDADDFMVDRVCRDRGAYFRALVAERTARNRYIPRSRASTG